VSILRLSFLGKTWWVVTAIGKRTSDWGKNGDRIPILKFYQKNREIELLKLHSGKMITEQGVYR
jgi:hypothetical protein